MSGSIPAPPSPIDPALLPFVFHADLTLGAIEIGVLVSTFLFGLLTVQCYVYTYRFPRDPLFLRMLVPIVWLLELGHTVCICNTLYMITVRQYGRPWLLEIPPNSLNIAVLLSGFIGPIEQGWFAHRIYKFSGKLYIPLTCAFLALLRWVGSITISVVALHRLTVRVYYERWSWLLTTILVIGAATDVLLALSLCYYLYGWRGGAFPRTTILVDRIMIWSIETGLLTSVSAVALLATFLTLEDTFVWIGIFSILARLFSNSFLASLNTRPALAKIYHDEVLQMSTVRSDAQPMSARKYSIYDADPPALSTPQTSQARSGDRRDRERSLFSSSTQERSRGSDVAVEVTVTRQQLYDEDSLDGRTGAGYAV